MGKTKSKPEDKIMFVFILIIFFLMFVTVAYIGKNTKLNQALNQAKEYYEDARWQWEMNSRKIEAKHNLKEI